jgi:hypothetical protein
MNRLIPQFCCAAVQQLLKQRKLNNDNAKDTVMIYLLGASHMAPVLQACSAEDALAQKQSIQDNAEPVFIDWQTNTPENNTRTIKAANIHISRFSPYWGPVLSKLANPARIEIAPGFQKLLASIDTHSPNNILFVFMRGEEHFHLGLKDHQVPFDFYLPWRPELQITKHKQVIPLHVIEKQVRAATQQSIVDFYAIKILCPHLRIINVVCPPPVPQLNEQNVSTRVKYYDLYVKILSESIASQGIESLPPPPSTITPEGLLDKQYHASGADRIHGNQLYGSKVWAQILTTTNSGVA